MPRKPQPTVAQIINAYRHHVQSNNKHSEPVAVRVGGLWNRFCKKHGSTRVSQITGADLCEWIDSQDWEPSTKHSCCKKIKAPFNWAWRVGRIPFNPFAEVQYEDGEPRRAMAWDEFRALLRVASPPVRRFLFFLWHTGARQGEVRELIWDHIDWQQCMIVQEKHKTAKKTRKPREIMLIPKAMKLLEWMTKNDCDPDDPHVFATITEEAWTLSNFCSHVARLREEAGLPDDLSAHCIRHAFATDQISAGADLTMVSLQLGHSSTETTRRRYFHVSPATRQAVRKAMQLGR